LALELLECDSTDGQSTKESDIFAAGSVFFYFLSNKAAIRLGMQPTKY
jgi:hypothetical protein